MIHRDLKPSNVMIDNEGKVRVMDFGLARSQESIGLTLTGALVGTPEYMAPEQAKGQAVDVQSDIYAAGLIFYELLTGKLPFPADNAFQSLMKRAHERALLVSQLDNTVPRVLSGIVSRCLEPDRRNRYQSAAELLADLEAYQPSGALSSTMVMRGQRAIVPGLYKWLTFILITVLVAAGVVAIHPRREAYSRNSSNCISGLCARRVETRAYSATRLFSISLSFMRESDRNTQPRPRTEVRLRSVRVEFL